MWSLVKLPLDFLLILSDLPDRSVSDAKLLRHGTWFHVFVEVRARPPYFPSSCLNAFDPHQTFWEGAPAFFPPLPALSLDEPPLGELRGMVRAASCFPSPSPPVVAVLQVRIPRHTHAACTRCRSRGLVRRLCHGGTRNNTCSADVLCRGGDSTCCPAACSVVPLHTV